MSTTDNYILLTLKGVDLSVNGKVNIGILGFIVNLSSAKASDTVCTDVLRTVFFVSVQAEQSNIQSRYFFLQVIISLVIVIVEARITENNKHVLASGVHFATKFLDSIKVSVLVSRNKKLSGRTVIIIRNHGIFFIRLFDCQGEKGKQFSHSPSHQ